MRRVVTVTVGLALASCHAVPIDASQPPGSPFPHPQPVEIPADRIAQARATAARGLAAVVSHELQEDLTAPATLDITPLAPIGAGIFADVALRDPETHELGRRWSQVYIGPGGIDGTPWVIRVRPPGAVWDRWSASTLDVHAWIDPAKAAIDVDATIDAHTTGDIALVLVYAHDLRVTQDGVPCRATVLDREVIVHPVHPGPHTRLRLQYSWMPGTHESRSYEENGEISRDYVVAGFGDPWIPWVIGKVETTITLVHPSALSWISPHKIIGTRAMAPGWSETQLHTTTPLATIIGETSWRELRIPGEVSMHLLPDGDDERPKLRDLFARILAADAPLGPPPSGEIRVVEVKRGTSAKNANGLIVLPHDWAIEDDVVAHEVAHLWFGQKLGQQTEDEVTWLESVAEYVSTWALDDAAANHQRAMWLVRYSIAASSDLALTSGDVLNLSRDDQDALKYAKGPLVLAALEARVGRPAMQRALAGLVKAYAGKKITWRDVATSFEATLGAEAGGWFRAWLARAQVPTLDLHDIHREGNVVTGVIRQEPAVLTDAIELGAWTSTAADRPGSALVKLGTVPLTGERTSFRLEVPPDARTLVLDPWHHVPRHPDGDAIDPEQPL